MPSSVSPTGRFGAVDVHYPPTGGARAALVLAADATFPQPLEVAPYEPGAFYRRELPPMLAVLRPVPVELVVVDGYVDLDPDGRPGLGARLHDALAVPVIGVAKTAFRSATHAVPVTRGTAIKPLYVTAAGLTRHRAAELVAAMAGPHRMPDALRRVDRLSRGEQQ